MSYFTRIMKASNRHDPEKVKAFFQQPDQAPLFSDEMLQRIAEDMITQIIEDHPGATTVEKADLIYRLFVTHPELSGLAHTGIDKKPSWHHAHVAQALQAGEHIPDPSMMADAMGVKEPAAGAKPKPVAASMGGQPAAMDMSGTARPAASPDERQAPRPKPQTGL